MVNRIPPTAVFRPLVTWKRKWSARLSIVNVTNKYALYNFLSTFSGTHYVAPRTVTGTVGFHF